MTFFLTKDLKVGYQQRIVVDDINIDLSRGEILCLLGPNGCGKSTILKTIIDHIKRLDGSITVLGKDLNVLSNKDRAKEMSIVLTEKISPEMMTAEEVVATGRYPYTNHFGKLTDEDWKIINESIEIVDGQSLRHKEFKALSDGEKQRVMIARAICQESDIMVLDEPTSFLDIRFKIDLLNILGKLSLDKNKTIIMSLHEIDLVPKIADKVLLIKNGKIYKYGTPEDVITDEAVNEVYDLNSGSFNTIIGNIELPRVIESPKVFVVGGGGKATKIYRALNKKGIGFYSGILFKNDIDYNASKTLAYKTIVEDCFVDIKPKKIDEAKEYIKDCHAVIDSGVSLVGINKGNYDLLRFASQEGVKILSLRDENAEYKLVKYHSISSMIDNIVDYL
ncbi:ABC transporter related [[Clostridium] ultunense Esp]|uniref:ABC transporter related n=1 Tax=[Clostridium] ultunense Esp TaxID=1288971 RepID=M1Z6I7_9FIRM|nr:ABC transporter ATP-binding protein [Schnuerera ultunensis]CCQ93359.1 ABC transporter related [[Clostridium] ultunense Esp]SHD77603.1 ABC transporter related [[Clostridium] ultunense Esp]